MTKGKQVKSPRPISTLVEAAKWMTEATGNEWTSESLLDFICVKMRDVMYQTLMGVDGRYSEAREKVVLHPVYCLEIALPPKTRVVYRFCDGKTVRHNRGELPLLALDDWEHVLSLIGHGAIELPYPLTSEPWNGAEGDLIDADTAPIITPESLRINDYGLIDLADIFNEENQQEATVK